MTTPKAVREAAIQLGSLTMRVYHLDDGRRIIHADDVAAFFAGDAGDVSHEDLTAFATALRGAKS